MSDSATRDDWAEFELYDGDEILAGASGKRSEAWKEIIHYIDTMGYVGLQLSPGLHVEEIVRLAVDIAATTPLPPPKAAK
jgi:hypothetical protein